MSFLARSLQNKTGLRRYIGPKRVILLLLLTGFFVLAWQLHRANLLSPAIIEHFRDTHPLEAVLLFVLVYALSVIAALPSLPLNLAAGYFWGGLLGGAYSTIGVTVGSWISFAAARWLIGQPLAENYDHKWVIKVQREFEKNGWKFVAFARMNPIIPTGPLNYLLGLTSLSNKGFLVATFVFLLPLSIAVAYIGDTLQTFASQQSGIPDFVRGLLVISGVVTFFALLKFAFSIFKDRTDEE